MAGAYTAYVVQQVLAVAGLSLLVSLPVAFVVAGLLGVLLEVTLLRRMYHRPLDTLLVTWGVALVLQQLARDLFGSARRGRCRRPRGCPAASRSSGSPSPGPGCSSWCWRSRRVTGLAVGLKAHLRSAAGSGRWCRTGSSPRAPASPPGTDRLTFFIGSGLAGVAGVALTLIGSIVPAPGTELRRRRLPGGRGRRHRPDQGRGDRGLRARHRWAWIEYTTTASLAKVIVFALIVAFLQVGRRASSPLRTRSLA